MSQIESLSQIEGKLNNLSLTAKNNIDNANTHEELDPLRVEKADELFGEGIEAWGCSGTPADCVKLALSELLDHKPDLVPVSYTHLTLPTRLMV